MNTRLLLSTAAGAILWLPTAQAGSRNGGSGSAAVVIPADTLSTGGGASTGGSGANAVTVTASMGGIIGTVTAASPAVTNQQGYIPQTLPVPMGLAEALDTTGLAWTAGGAAPWFGQTTITHDGVDAARSGFISDSQESFVEAAVTGPGLLNFWWKVS